MDFTERLFGRQEETSWICDQGLAGAMQAASAAMKAHVDAAVGKEEANPTSVRLYSALILAKPVIEQAITDEGRKPLFVSKQMLGKSTRIHLKLSEAGKEKFTDSLQGLDPASALVAQQALDKGLNAASLSLMAHRAEKRLAEKPPVVTER